MDRRHAVTALALSTVAFAVCFACWVVNGVLVTYLVDARILAFDKTQIGWLIGAPILTGALLRLPLGMMTDRWGGRNVFTALMLSAAVPMVLLSAADGFVEFLLAGMGVGLAGASFAVGVAYTSRCFPAEKQGTVLGIFGLGNGGAALTALVAPALLARLTEADPDGWRMLPRLYAAALVVVAAAFYGLTRSPSTGGADRLTFAAQLAPLGSIRVWRFGAYYLIVFGGFVALSQWMIPYFVNAYQMSVADAGALAAAFILPSALSRVLGGWIADRWGARSAMYRVFGAVLVLCLLLMVPRMDIESPGEGVMASEGGRVTSVSPEAVVVGDRLYPLATRPARDESAEERSLRVWPEVTSWQEPVVSVGLQVEKRRLIARGVTRIHFQANVWIFTGLLVLLGVAMGIGMAVVFKFIPQYFPRTVGTTGGVVGVIGGLGGFFFPIAFGYLLGATGLWTSCWLLLALLTAACFAWFHRVVRAIVRQRAPELAHVMDHPGR